MSSFKFPSFRLPTGASFFVVSYFGIMLTGCGIMGLGILLNTDASKVSGAMLGFFTALYLPLVFCHVAGYREQVYKSEWLFIAVTLLPLPFWLYTMFFIHVDNDQATLLALPAVTFFLAFLLPSSKENKERVPVWHRTP